VRSLESVLEKIARGHAARGMVEISLDLRFSAGAAGVVGFNRAKAGAMLTELAALARENGHEYRPDYNRLLEAGHLWEEAGLEPEGELEFALTEGLGLALEDWNESRVAEAQALERDLAGRILRMEEWLKLMEAEAPAIKEEHLNLLRRRLDQALAGYAQELEEKRFLQEVVLLADKLDVSEELTRLRSHFARLRELLAGGADVGRRLDFTLQECFREINTCGNKIQHAGISRLVVVFKNELEICREQVQNIE
jgi:uncharacterized protein (TIGR00255 family)